MHVLARRGGGRGSGRLAHDADDFSAALCYLCDELSIQPFCVAYGITNARLPNLAEVCVRVLRSRVIAPDNDVADIIRIDLLTSLGGDLTEGTHLIQPRHGGELLLRDAGCICRRD